MSEAIDANAQRRELLRERLRSHEGLTAKACIVVTLVIAVISFFGLREIIGGSGLDALVVPLVAAAGGGVLFWVIWHKLFDSLPLMESQVRRTQIILIAAAVLVFQVLFSSWPVATKVSGAAAITEHLSRYNKEARSVLLRAFVPIEEQSQLIGELETAAAADRAHAQLEVRGAHTGIPGEGVVASAYSSAAENLDSMASTMRSEYSDAQQEKEAGLKILGGMDRLVADSSISNDDRQRQYADLAVRLGDSVDKLNSTDLTTPLNGLIGGVAYRVQMTSTQRAALDDAQRTNTLLNEDLKKKAANLRKNASAATVPVFVPMSAGMAVVNYAQEVPMGWAIAIGLDTLPFLLLIATLIGHLDTRRPSDPPALGPVSAEPSFPRPIPRDGASVSSIVRGVAKEADN